VWTPGGTKVIYASGRAFDLSDNANAPNGTRNIWVMNADGSNAVPLTKLTVNPAGADLPEQP
jgi:hypothetical protein